MLTKPRWLLHLEGASILVLAVVLYRAGHFSWGLFAFLFLAPDLFMLGYLIDVTWGAAFYNLVHTYVGSVALLLPSFLLPAPRLTTFGLIWLAHLGFDRMLGFGLKYPTFFKDTHLQRV
ncbi:MAG TPA: DUF4260 domain-containing protein [Candidatus Acidoferrum sp.]|jgi:hypothetical protein